MEFRKQAHTTYYTRYHLVFVTKYRRKVLVGGMGAYAAGAMRRVCNYYPDIVLLEVNTDEDHIHLLMSIPPKMSISKAVNLLKTNSARAMRHKFPFIQTIYDRHIGLWSDGYFVSTVGVNEEQIRRYIEHQGKEDSAETSIDLGL